MNESDILLDGLISIDYNNNNNGESQKVKETMESIRDGDHTHPSGEHMESKILRDNRKRQNASVPKRKT